MKLQSITDTTLNWAGQREIKVVFAPETESTNDDAKDSALNENENLVIYLTSHQTKGRGRNVNHWLDTGAGESLLSTWSMTVPSPPQAITAPRVGLAVLHAVAKTWPSLNWSLKAPNDLFLNGKKCGGLLVETVSDGAQHRLLIGLGFNILNHPRKFNDATHLSPALTQPLEEGEWFQFLDELNDEFEGALVDIQQPELTETACKQLMQALNANPAAAMAITKVTPRGDLVHKGGTVPWTSV